nr:MAG TPA: Zinc-finger double domain protein [Caudoviricetes sp.]
MLLPFGYPSVDKVRICYPCNRSFHHEVILTLNW